MQRFIVFLYFWPLILSIYFFNLVEGRLAPLIGLASGLVQGGLAGAIAIFELVFSGAGRRRLLFGTSRRMERAFSVPEPRTPPSLDMLPVPIGRAVSGEPHGLGTILEDGVGPQQLANALAVAAAQGPRDVLHGVGRIPEEVDEEVAVAELEPVEPAVPEPSPSFISARSSSPPPTPAPTPLPGSSFSALPDNTTPDTSPPAQQPPGSYLRPTEPSMTDLPLVTKEPLGALEAATQKAFLGVSSSEADQRSLDTVADAPQLPPAHKGPPTASLPMTEQLQALQPGGAGAVPGAGLTAPALGSLATPQLAEPMLTMPGPSPEAAWELDQRPALMKYVMLHRDSLSTPLEPAGPQGAAVGAMAGGGVQQLGNQQVAPGPGTAGAARLIANGEKQATPLAAGAGAGGYGMLGAVAVAGAGGDAAVVDAPGVSGAAATGAMAGATPAAPEQLVQQQVQGGSEWINPFSGTQELAAFASDEEEPAGHGLAGITTTVANGPVSAPLATMAPAPSISRQIESEMFDMVDLQALLKTGQLPTSPTATSTSSMITPGRIGEAGRRQPRRQPGARRASLDSATRLQARPDAGCGQWRREAGGHPAKGNRRADQ